MGLLRKLVHLTIGRSYPPYTLYPLYLDKVSVYQILDKVPNPAAGKLFTLLDFGPENQIFVMTISTISIY